MQYLITVYDHKDNLEARLKVREEHLLGIKKLINSKNIIKAGAIIENNIMVGSSLFVEFNSDDDINLWLSVEPYVTSNVWNMNTFSKIEVKVLDA